MDEQKCFKTETLKNFERLNKKVSELVKLQHKVGMGFNYVSASELASYWEKVLKPFMAGYIINRFLSINRVVRFYYSNWMKLRNGLKQVVILPWMK